MAEKAGMFAHMCESETRALWAGHNMCRGEGKGVSLWQFSCTLQVCGLRKKRKKERTKAHMFLKPERKKVSAGYGGPKALDQRKVRQEDEEEGGVRTADNKPRPPLFWGNKLMSVLSHWLMGFGKITCT